VAVAGLVSLVAVFALVGNTAPASPDPVAPAVLHAPTNLYAYGTSGDAVVLSWQPSRPPPIGYRIYRTTGRHGPYTIVGEVMAPDMDTFTDSTGLMPGTTYSYTVTAFDRQGKSAPVGPIIALVLGAPGPTPTVAVPAPLPTFAVPTSAPRTARTRSSRR
jgi:hypothetical protein